MITTVFPKSASRWTTSRSFRTSSRWEPGRRLVEDVQRLPGVGAGELGRELDALGLAAGERRHGLAEQDSYPRPTSVQRLQGSSGSGRGDREQSERIVDAHGRGRRQSSFLGT